MTEEKQKISCWKCRNLQVSTIVFSLITILTIMITIYQIQFPQIGVNPDFVLYAIMYGLGFGVIGLCMFGAIFLIKNYCNDEPEIRLIENLIMGFVLAFFGVIILIGIFYYLPATMEEYTIKIADKSLHYQMILQLSCRTFEMSYESEYNRYRHNLSNEPDYIYYEGEPFMKKHGECIKLD